MFKLIKVSGDSMSPTLLDGDIVITTKPRTIRAGLIYVIDHSDLGRIIKRIERFDAKGRAVLSGDNKGSTPASLMGTVEHNRIIRRAIFAFSRKGARYL